MQYSELNTSQLHVSLHHINDIILSNLVSHFSIFECDTNCQVKGKEAEN